jgi:hypothetical protein
MKTNLLKQLKTLIRKGNKEDRPTSNVGHRSTPDISKLNKLAQYRRPASKSTIANIYASSERLTDELQLNKLLNAYGIKPQKQEKISMGNIDLENFKTPQNFSKDTRAYYKKPMNKRQGQNQGRKNRNGPKL